MSNATMKITLPNGMQIDLNGDLTSEEVRQHLTALNVANLSGAIATETNREGQRAVAFTEPAGTRKG
jgi:hypothetical protein